MGLIETIGAVIAAIAAAFWFGRRQGGKSARTTMQQRDRDNADKIRDAADRARRADDAGHVDAAERLRKAGRLRD